MTAITESTLLRTALTDWHAAQGGRLVDFAGWHMPVQYGSITDEHVATRTAVGLFDVSHMGRLAITGPDATQLLDQLLTRNITKLTKDQIRYSLVCEESGGTLDDILVGRLHEENETPSYNLVVNASNREKLVSWFEKHFVDKDVSLTDHTTETAMIAVQGPQAIELLNSNSDVNLDDLKYYTQTKGNVFGLACSISRTGYTGEDGVELICSNEVATQLWQSLVDAGGKPCGLASRDTLRLEAAMPLYGHELSEELNPIQAGLKFAVQLKDRQFVGRDALAAAVADDSQLVRVGLVIEGRRPPREGYDVMAEGLKVGWVSSGAPSPTLGQMIAMAFVPKEHAEIGTALEVDLRGKPAPAKVVSLPFYTRPS